MSQSIVESFLLIVVGFLFFAGFQIIFVLFLGVFFFSTGRGTSFFKRIGAAGGEDMQAPVFHSRVFSFLDFTGRGRLGRTCLSGRFRQRHELGHGGLRFRWVLLHDKENLGYCSGHVRGAHGVFFSIRRLRIDTNKRVLSMGRLCDPDCSLFVQDGVWDERIADAVMAVRGLRSLEYVSYSAHALGRAAAVIAGLRVHLNHCCQNASFFLEASPRAERIGWIDAITSPLPGHVLFAAFSVSGEWFAPCAAILRHAASPRRKLAVAIDSATIDEREWTRLWDGYSGGRVYVALDSCTNAAGNDLAEDLNVLPLLNATPPGVRLSIVLVDHPHPLGTACRDGCCEPRGVFDVTEAFPFLVPNDAMVSCSTGA